jgi:hypothetical protein
MAIRDTRATAGSRAAPWGASSPSGHHDRLVGKVDATADRKQSVVDVHAVHEDVPFTMAMTEAVDPADPPAVLVAHGRGLPSTGRDRLRDHG